MWWRTRTFNCFCEWRMVWTWDRNIGAQAPSAFRQSQSTQLITSYRSMAARVHFNCNNCILEFNFIGATLNGRLFVCIGSENRVHQSLCANTHTPRQKWRIRTHSFPGAARAARSFFYYLIYCPKFSEKGKWIILLRQQPAATAFGIQSNGREKEKTNRHPAPALHYADRWMCLCVCNVHTIFFSYNYANCNFGREKNPLHAQLLQTITKWIDHNCHQRREEWKGWRISYIPNALNKPRLRKFHCIFNILKFDDDTVAAEEEIRTANTRW